MAEKFLYEDLDSFSKLGGLQKEIPTYLTDNLNPAFELASLSGGSLRPFLSLSQ